MSKIIKVLKKIISLIKILYSLKKKENIIYQTNKDLNKEIQEHGCYFLCLMYMVCKYLKIDMFGIVQLNSYWTIFKSLHCINKEHTILDPQGIIEYFTKNILFKGEHTKYNYITKENEYEIQFWQNGEYTHFVFGKNGEIEYDPLIKANTIKHGELISKRIFVIKEST